MADSYRKIPLIRLQAVREKEMGYSYGHIDKPEKAAEFLAQVAPGADREYAVVCCVDAAMQPVSVEIAAVGTINQCGLLPREVFKNAVLSNAAYVILMHNHPSGNTEPSEEDKEITERMKGAGDLLGIPLLDHIILGDSGFYSFRENGLV